jgi:hypothetical protein
VLFENPLEPSALFSTQSKQDPKAERSVRARIEYSPFRLHSQPSELHAFQRQPLPLLESLASHPANVDQAGRTGRVPRQPRVPFVVLEDLSAVLATAPAATPGYVEGKGE